jgi:hypothetical protein
VIGYDDPEAVSESKPFEPVITGAALAVEQNNRKSRIRFIA